MYVDKTSTNLFTSSSLHFNHPTESETIRIWNQTSNDWEDAFTVPQYLEENAYLLTVSLARNNSITEWILIDNNQPADKRTVLASWETFLKRALFSDSDGKCEEVIAHGIASVYCEPGLRKLGYASRLLKDMLYSDIDPGFYQRLGWNPFPSYHLEFEPKVTPYGATPLYAEDLAALCGKDEAILRTLFSEPSTESRPRFAVVPDHDHLVWHHSKEEFGAQRLFSKIPLVKGAIAGPPGNRVWAIWMHRFYRHLDSRDSSANILYILRFVIEDRAPAAGDVRAIFQAAQTDAAEWELGKESIPCLQWYRGDGLPSTLDWVLNEKYAWS
ncbi:hypothetical protein BJY01DRAFT_258967 [Aspergillus pseudoustus]|uniref:LYC1 C-terminal domain-containing protein n=1 Tax=Aspergillus pseudoustus TaxID=1810923 RepID=A0ABR4J6I4_9EURO